MITQIVQQRREIEVLCRRVQVHRLEVFGSAATGAFRGEDSGILEFDEEIKDPAVAGYADRYFGLQESLEQLFGRRVDLPNAATARRTFADYEADAVLRAAVDRQLEIIGEALAQLGELGEVSASQGHGVRFASE